MNACPRWTDRQTDRQTAWQ